MRSNPVMRRLNRTFFVCLGAAALGAACSSPQSARAGDTAGEPSRDTVAARARIAQLEADARALVKMDGCSTAARCRTAPVGARACGGPRTYLVYCAATTDSVALFRKLGELSAMEAKYNASTGIASTCEMRMPPNVTAQAGSCREATP